MPEEQRFSTHLKNWLNSTRPKTLKELEEVFGERSFAAAYVLLLVLPALPLPTGGVTHIFEILAALLALEQFAGLQHIWLPEKYQKKQLPAFMIKKALPQAVKKIAWLEKWSRPRGQSLMFSRWFSRLVSVLILACIAGAFFAPPFSGLDTLPALGVVLIALGILLGDFAFFIAGVLSGAVGIALMLAIGKALSVALKHLLTGVPKGYIWAGAVVLLGLLIFAATRHKK